MLSLSVALPILLPVEKDTEPAPEILKSELLLSRNPALLPPPSVMVMIGTRVAPLLLASLSI